MIAAIRHHAERGFAYSVTCDYDVSMKDLRRWASMVAPPILYCVVLWVYSSYALYQGVSDANVAIFLILTTAGLIGCWYYFGTRLLSRKGSGRLWLAFASGIWIATAIALFIGYAFMHTFYGASFHLSF
jgi:hypothetical protein